MPYVLIALALLGLAISTYLVTTHYGKQPIACAGVGDCTAVNSSSYANVGGVPVSLLGIGLYAGLASLGYYWSLRPRDDGRVIAYWGLALSGAGYAVYLTYIEIAVLHAICVWCVASATILGTSLVVSTIAVLSNPDVAAERPRHSRRIVS